MKVFLSCYCSVRLWWIYKQAHLSYGITVTLFLTLCILCLMTITDKDLFRECYQLILLVKFLPKKSLYHEATDCLAHTALSI